jgi:hypothetical protein
MLPRKLRHERLQVPPHGIVAGTHQRNAFGQPGLQHIVGHSIVQAGHAQARDRRRQRRVGIGQQWVTVTVPPLSTSRPATVRSAVPCRGRRGRPRQMSAQLLHDEGLQQRSQMS